MEAPACREIDERISRATEAFRCCRLCPRDCAVDRVGGELGYCGLDEGSHCFREMMHWGEERELIPSHQVYFAGCNLRCVHCTVAEWNEQPVEVDAFGMCDLCKLIGLRQKEGARTLNLLGGEPAIHVCSILQLLAQLEVTTCVVWNSNMYYSEIVRELMSGLIDVYLADLKVGSEDCADRLLDASDYVGVARGNILAARADARVIVRHVVLPGHERCCLDPTLRWLSEEAPDVKVSLRGDYVPPAGSSSAPADYLTAEELERARLSAHEKGLNIIE